MIGAASQNMASAAASTAAAPAAGAGIDASTHSASDPAPAPANQPGRSAGAARPGRTGGERKEAATPPSAFADLLAQVPVPVPAPAAAPTSTTARAKGAEPGVAPGQLPALLDGRWSAARAAPAAAAVAGPAVPSAAAPAPLTSIAARAEGAAGTEAGVVPEQLLALLDGSWSAARATPGAAAGPTAASSAQAPGLPSDVTAAPAPATLPATDVATGATAPTAAAATPEPAFAELAMAALPADAWPEGSTGATQPGVAIEAAAAAAPAARTQAATPLPPLQMPADPGAGFDDGLGTRVVWMAEQRLGHAEIRLNPEHIGPIEVRVELDGEQVRAEFHSAHAEVRQAIEGSLPRLRELLGQHGLQLGHADVGQGQAGREGGDARANASARGGDAGGSGEDLQPRPAPVRARGLVDEYA